MEDTPPIKNKNTKKNANVLKNGKKSIKIVKRVSKRKKIKIKSRNIDFENLAPAPLILNTQDITNEYVYTTSDNPEVMVAVLGMQDDLISDNNENMRCKDQDKKREAMSVLNQDNLLKKNHSKKVTSMNRSLSVKRPKLFDFEISQNSPIPIEEASPLYIIDTDRKQNQEQSILSLVKGLQKSRNECYVVQPAKPLPLKTIGNVSVAAAHSNEFETGHFLKHLEKPASNNGFQIDLISDPDDEEIEKKATIDYDIPLLIRNLSKKAK